MAKFEVAKGYEDKNINLPVRKTACSAGYDFEVAEDIFIPSYFDQMGRLKDACETQQGYCCFTPTLSLGEMASISKLAGAKPTLVPTGIKCKLGPDTYLELSVRSSCPLKYWLILANSVGIIDADYYGNPDNDGHIYFQMINLSPFDLQLKKGDIIGQGIIKPYITTDDDEATGERLGGFGSTSNA